MPDDFDEADRRRVGVCTPGVAQGNAVRCGRRGRYIAAVATTPRGDDEAPSARFAERSRKDYYRPVSSCASLMRSAIRTAASACMPGNLWAYWCSVHSG